MSGPGSYRFMCRKCGETHEGIPDVGFKAPHYYWTVPEAEREERCFLTPDLCVIDDSDFFIRGVVEIPIHTTSEVFAWGVWSSVSETNFRLYREVYDHEDQARQGPFPGWLSSRIPDYPDTLKLAVRAHLRDSRTRPRVELEPTAHPLAVEQREGIRFEKLERILERHLHPGE